METTVAQEIARKAIEVVGAFCATDPTVRPRSLLPREGEAVHAELRAFAHHVVLLEHATDWGQGAYLRKEVAAEEMCLFRAADVRTLPGAKRNNLQGYGSWLWQAFPGSYAAVFDRDLIAHIAAHSQNSQSDASVKLYLHELGHFVLHRRQLFDGLKGATLARVAHAKMEEEAWFFTYIVLGLARGDWAFLANSVVDDTWRSGGL